MSVGVHVDVYLYIDVHICINIFSGPKCLQNVTTLTIYWFYKVFTVCCVPYASPYVQCVSRVFIPVDSSQSPDFVQFARNTYKHYGYGERQKKKKK